MTTCDSSQISDDQNVLLAKKLASCIVSLGLQVPAVLFLELHKPLCGILHTASLACAPLASPLFGAERISTLSEFLTSSENIDLLIATIEMQAIQTATHSGH